MRVERSEVKSWMNKDASLSPHHSYISHHSVNKHIGIHKCKAQWQM